MSSGIYRIETLHHLTYISLAVTLMMHGLIVDLWVQAFMLVYSCICSSYYKRVNVVIIFFVHFSPQECNIRMLTNAKLKKKQPDAPENGMIINNTVNQCDPFNIMSTFSLESLLWPCSVLDWSHNFNTTGFNLHSSEICTV